MKVVVCGVKTVPSFLGGTNRCVEETCARLAAKGHTITVYCRGEREREFRHRGFLVHQLPYLSSKYLCYFSYMGRAFSRIVRNHDRSTLVHMHAPAVNGLWSTLLKLLGYRVVVQTHGFAWCSPKWPCWFRLIMKSSESLGASTADAVICVSSETVEYHKKRRLGRNTPCYLVLNGLPQAETGADTHVLEQFKLSKGGYYLFVGRLVPEKCIQDLMHAFRLAKSAKKLVIVGGGSYTDTYVNGLEHLAKEVGNVVLMGSLDHESVMGLHEHAFAFVLPSMREGCPLALLEAVSCSTVCIVSDIPSHREIGGDDILYFPVGDRAALAEIMRALEYSQEDYYQSRDKVSQLSKSLPTWDEVAALIEQIYLSLAPRSDSDKV